MRSAPGRARHRRDRQRARRNGSCRAEDGNFDQVGIHVDVAILRKVSKATEVSPNWAR